MDKGLETLDIYQISLSLSRKSRDIFSSYDYMTKKIIGEQYIRAIDSIGANIAEGYGRFHYLDSVKFYYIARGSLSESKHRIKLMYERKLVSENIYKNIREDLNTLGKKLNNFISSIKEKLKN